MFVEEKPRTVFFLQTLDIYRAGLKNHNIRAWGTGSWVSSGLDNVKQLLQLCMILRSLA